MHRSNRPGRAIERRWAGCWRRKGGPHRLAQRQLDGRIAVHVDASDIIQQTFLEAHRSFQQFAGQDARQLVAWLEGILDHKVAGAIRDHTLLQKRNVQRDRSLDDSHKGMASLKQELDAGLSTPSQKAIRGEQEQLLMQALGGLPDDQREAVRLRHLEGWRWSTSHSIWAEVPPPPRD